MMTKKQLIERKLKTMIRRIMNEQEITMNGRGTGVTIGHDKKGYFFSYDGENYSGEYFSYIDDVLNSNGIVMTKDKNGNKKLVHLSDYIPEEDIDESRYMGENRKRKRRF